MSDDNIQITILILRQGVLSRQAGHGQKLVLGQILVESEAPTDSFE